MIPICLTEAEFDKLQLGEILYFSSKELYAKVRVADSPLSRRVSKPDENPTIRVRIVEVLSLFEPKEDLIAATHKQLFLRIDPEYAKAIES